MLRHSLRNKRRGQHQFNEESLGECFCISSITATQAAGTVKMKVMMDPCTFMTRCLYANQRHFLWSLRDVFCYSVVQCEEGRGDVEMAGMTMTLVSHMRMMSSIVLWAGQSVEPAPALYGIISPALSSLWCPAPAQLKSRFHHIPGSYSQRDSKIPDYFCSISSQHSPGLDLISERQI